MAIYESDYEMELLESQRQSGTGLNISDLCEDLFPQLSSIIVGFDRFVDEY